MGIKMLADKAGPLQGIDADSVARMAYGKGVHYDGNQTVEGEYVGVISRISDGMILDTVVELHDV